MTSKAERKEQLTEVKMYISNGWDLAEETPEYFVLKRNTSTTSGQILIFLFLGWWSFLIPNVVYYLLGKKTKKIVK